MAGLKTHGAVVLQLATAAHRREMFIAGEHQTAHLLQMAFVPVLNLQSLNPVILRLVFLTASAHGSQRHRPDMRRLVAKATILQPIQAETVLPMEVLALPGGHGLFAATWSRAAHPVHRHL